MKTVDTKRTENEIPHVAILPTKRARTHVYICMFWSIDQVFSIVVNILQQQNQVSKENLVPVQQFIQVSYSVSYHSLLRLVYVINSEIIKLRKNSLKVQ